MKIEAFWQQIAEAINGECEECPVYQYAVKTNTKRMCDKVCVCADGLMMLHKKLQEEERQKIDIGLTAVNLEEYKATKGAYKYLDKYNYNNGYKDGYKAGWNSCIRDSAEGWTIDYMD